MATGSNRKIRILLAAVIFFGLAAMVTTFLGYRHLAGKPQSRKIPRSLAAVIIEKYRQQTTKNGLPQWDLNARTASLDNAAHKADLSDLKVTFYLQNEERALLTADHGVLFTDRNDIEVTGHVVVQNKTYRVETQRLDYVHARQTLTANVPVTVTGPRIKLTADGVTVYLPTDRALFKGHVDAYLDIQPF